MKFICITIKNNVTVINSDFIKNAVFMAYRGIVMDERVYFKGNAVIDEQLNMLEADDEIKNFFFYGGRRQ